MAHMINFVGMRPFCPKGDLRSDPRCPGSGTFEGTRHMAELNLVPIVESGFALVPISGAPPKVRFTGNGDSEAIAPLARFLRQLHSELLLHHLTQVNIDLGDLYFMNSSCLKNFVSWIHKVDTEGKPYEITLLTNPRLQWQQRSLAGLQKLAPTIVSIAEVSL
jgi:hypothetical protein